MAIAYLRVGSISCRISKKLTTLPETLVLQLQFLYQTTEHVEKYALPKFEFVEQKKQENSLLKSKIKHKKSNNLERN